MAIIHWKLGVNGDFAVAANWNPALIPGAGDVAAIDAPGTYTVGSTVDQTVNSLRTIATATLSITSGFFTIINGTGTGANAGTIAIGNGAELDLGGVVKNTGKIKESSTGDLTLLNFEDGATLTGGGKVILSDSAGNVVAGGHSSAPFTNVDNTISGAGGIGGPFGTALVNEAKGVINATGKINPLLIATASPVTNLGVLEATGPAGLIIATTVDNGLTGIVQAMGPSSVVSLLGATLIGGTLKTVNGGVIRVDGSSSTSTLDGSALGAPVTNTGRVVVTDSNTLELIGTIANTGSIAINSTGSFTQLLIGAGGAVLKGGGKVTLADSTITAASFATTLANVDNTISGDGSITDFNITNGTKGVINATKNGSEIFLGFANCSNAGLLEATGGSTLFVSLMSVNNTATGVVAALGAGSKVLLETARLAGGTLKTAGGGKIEVHSDSTLDGSTLGAPVNNAANLVVDNGQDLFLVGAINNTGTIAVNSTGNLTELRLDSGGAALTGGGKVVLTAGSQIIGSAPGDKLVNVDNIISGAGTLSPFALVNGAKGVINANALDAIIYSPLGADPVSNAGTLEVTNAGGMSIAADVVNSGTIKLAFAGALLSIAGTVTNNGKLLATAGTLFIESTAPGAGSATINYGGMIAFGVAATGITQNVTFANVGTGTATLQFNALATTDPNRIYNGVISGFSSPKDRIDLAGLAFSGNTSLTKALQGGNTIIEVTESGKVVDLTLAGNHMADHFVVSDDGFGGTLIVDPPAVANANLSRLAQAMASFAPAPLIGAAINAMQAGGWGEHAMLAGSHHHG